MYSRVNELYCDFLLVHLKKILKARGFSYEERIDIVFSFLVKPILKKEMDIFLFIGEVIISINEPNIISKYILIGKPCCDDSKKSVLEVLIEYSIKTNTLSKVKRKWVKSLKELRK